ncbi:MAG: hypothetical protein ACYC7D_05960 [Nitrososphaerales archaeon]
MSDEEIVEDPLSLDERRFKVYIVYLILNKETEKAVEIISSKYKLRKPRLSIGISKGKKKALGVYSVESNAISFKDQDQFFNPFVVLHEMYHCIRSTSGAHRGNEKNADKFALDYIWTFNEIAKTKTIDAQKIASESVD